MNKHGIDSSDHRARNAITWASQQLELTEPHATMVAGDASFRRYLRISEGHRSWIIMDAPPEFEDTAPYLDVTERLLAAGIHAPQVIGRETGSGFLLLEDLGDNLLRDALRPDEGPECLDALLNVMARMARYANVENLPPYDEALLQQELELFTTWFLGTHLGLKLNQNQEHVWQDLVAALIASAQAQSQVFVHRDFHSCNLLELQHGEVGVIDFQDAVQGPVTYDLASLLWDRYIPWPRERLEHWMEQARLLLSPDTAPREWVRWVDWMGLQRNLKIVGIFARLHYRDGKSGYLEMTPRFLSYIQDVLPRYEAFTDFQHFLKELPCAR